MSLMIKQPICFYPIINNTNRATECGEFTGKVAVGLDVWFTYDILKVTCEKCLNILVAKEVRQKPLPILEDVVAHPKHYNSGKIEVIEFIEDQGLCFHLGNVVKYASRAGKKDPARTIEDLEKAAWYLARKIELLQSARDDRAPVRPNDMVKKS